MTADLPERTATAAELADHAARMDRALHPQAPAVPLAPPAADGEPGCGDLNPENHYICTAARGHKGNHVPHGAADTQEGLRARSWPQETVPYALVVMVGGEAFEAVFEHGSDVAVLQVRGLEQAERLAKSASKIKAVTKRVECAAAAVARARANEAAAAEDQAEQPVRRSFDTFPPDSADLAPRATGDEEDCDATHPPGYVCLAARGHRGDHVAYGDEDGSVCATWPQAERQEAEAVATLSAAGLARPLGVAEEAAEDVQPDPERTAYIIGLRKLADILESNPVVPLPLNSGAPYSPVLFRFHGSVAREELAAAVRAFPCAFAKDADGKWLNLDGKLAGLHVQLYASRDQVCTRRVVGTEEREVEVEVTPAVKEKRTETVEVVEWDCHPILADDKAAGR